MLATAGPKVSPGRAGQAASLSSDGRRAVRMQTALVVDAARAGAFPRDTPDYPLDEAIPRRRAADCAVM